VPLLLITKSFKMTYINYTVIHAGMKRGSYKWELPVQYCVVNATTVVGWNENRWRTHPYKGSKAFLNRLISQVNATD